MKSISQLEENWINLPERLRGRGDFLKSRGQIKDAELMYDAATEIERTRERLRFSAGSLEVISNDN